MRSILLAAFAAALRASVAFGQGDVPPAARAEFDKAEVAREEGRMKAASELYRKAIDLHPLYEEAHAGYLAALRGSGELATAEAFYAGLVGKHPESTELKAFRAATLSNADAAKALQALASEDNLRVWLETARVALEAGEWRDAERAAKSALKKQSDSLAARLLLGDAYFQAGLFPKARREYEAVLEVDYASVPGQLRLGLCLHRDGKSADGMAILDRLVGADNLPRLVAGHWLRALILSETGKLPEAVAAIDQVLAIAGEDYGALMAKGHLLLMAEQPAAAVKVFSTALLGRPNSPEALFCLGWAQEKAAEAPQTKAQDRAERLLAAAEAYEKCAAADPTVRPRDSLGFVHLLSGRHVEAVTQFKRASDIDPDFAPAVNNLGLAQDLADKRTDAKKSYERVIAKIDKKNVRAHVMLALDHWLDGSHSKAIQLLEKALKVAPEDDLAWTFLGDVHYDTGKVERALRAYEEATEVNPKNFIAWYHMGIAYEDKRKFEDADRCYRKALEARPDPPTDLVLRLAELNDEGLLERLEDALRFYQLFLDLGGQVEWVPARIEELKAILEKR